MDGAIEGSFPNSITPMALQRRTKPRHTVPMDNTRQMRSRAMSYRRPQHGATLLETCAALALSSIAALTVVAGARPLTCAVRIGAARTVLAGALLEARREAYARSTTVSVEARVGDGQVVVHPPGSAHRLGDGVSLTSVPSDGNVQFRATGLADNATLSIACGRSTASVVVNQRGVIR
jgi:hypothetical protein